MMMCIFTLRPSHLQQPVFVNNPSFVYLLPIRTPIGPSEDRINKSMELPPLGTIRSLLPSARSRWACGLSGCRTCVCVAHDVQVAWAPTRRDCCRPRVVEPKLSPRLQRTMEDLVVNNRVGLIDPKGGGDQRGQ
jgi:hypothetical protein